MIRRVLYLILPLITLFLEKLPYGAVCNFANPDGEPWSKTYSYFDLLPFGYANFAPLITAILTCIIVFLLIIYFVINSEGLILFIRNTLIIAAIISLCPLLLGTSYFSFVGGLITVSLLIEAILIHCTYME